MFLKSDESNQSISFEVLDESGLAVTTRTASNFTISYQRRLNGVPLSDTFTSVSLSDLLSVNATHSDGGLIHINDGEYRVDLPDAATVTGADSLNIRVVSDQIGDTVIYNDSWLIGTLSSNILKIEGDSVQHTSGLMHSKIVDINDDLINTDSFSSNLIEEIRNQITGGNYSLNTNDSGKIRIAVGTSNGEILLTGGIVNSNIKQINDNNIIGDGKSTPFQPEN